ncbi:hypothetical protein PCE1_004117 [Barthelona sp. PCE]
MRSKNTVRLIENRAGAISCAFDNVRQCFYSNNLFYSLEKEEYSQTLFFMKVDRQHLRLYGEVTVHCELFDTKKFLCIAGDKYALFHDDVSTVHVYDLMNDEEIETFEDMETVVRCAGNCLVFNNMDQVTPVLKMVDGKIVWRQMSNFWLEGLKSVIISSNVPRIMHWCDGYMGINESMPCGGSRSIGDDGSLPSYIIGDYYFMVDDYHFFVTSDGDIQVLGERGARRSIGSDISVDDLVFVTDRMHVIRENSIVPLSVAVYDV